VSPAWTSSRSPVSTMLPTPGSPSAAGGAAMTGVASGAAAGASAGGSAAGVAVAGAAPGAASGARGALDAEFLPARDPQDAADLHRRGSRAARGDQAVDLGARVDDGHLQRRVATGGVDRRALGGRVELDRRVPDGDLARGGARTLDGGDLAARLRDLSGATARDRDGRDQGADDELCSVPAGVAHQCDVLPQCRVPSRAGAGAATGAGMVCPR
jgi:hypothetical protein